MNIERISTPHPDVFKEKYVLVQKPVILTDLFAGQPIAQLASLDQAQAVLGEMPILIQEEVTSFSLKNSTLLRTPVREFWSFNDYIAHIEAHPETRKMSTEGITPDEVRGLFDLPECTQIDSEEQNQDIYSFLFLGNACNYAHLHFDGDYCQVLLHQVFGTKRAILIPAIAARKLNPLRNFSTFFLENFSEPEKAEFVKYMGGYDCFLYPGETLFMPAGIWHYLEYRDTAMSFNLRFGRNRYTRFLGDKLHPNMYLQNIATKLVDMNAAALKYPSIMPKIEEAYYRPYHSPLEKGKVLQRLFEDLYQQLYPEVPHEIYALTNFASFTETLLQADAQRLYQTPFSLSI